MKRLAGAVIDRLPYLWPIAMTFYRVLYPEPATEATEADLI